MEYIFISKWQEWLSVILITVVSFYFIKCIVYICESVWNFFWKQVPQILMIVHSANAVEQEDKTVEQDKTVEEKEQHNFNDDYELFQKMCELVKINAPDCEHFQSLCEQRHLYVPENVSERNQVLVGLCLEMIVKLCKNGPNVTTAAIRGEEADEELSLWLRELNKAALRLSSSVTPSS
uniref:Uncharacterized protein n=1 Tax=Cuerna arida TaxID=1464854 RepID=A0A1B6FSK1_9HEMI